jgi:two-component system phosphate regulon response regulator OmpR
VDDDEALTVLLEASLRREGYEPRLCGDAARAEQELGKQSFDLILLDVMLPDRSGFEFCAELRNRGLETPILMLTARGNVNDRVTGLRIGADDYLPKPFEVPELVARIEALLRRCQSGRPDTGVFEFGDWCLNLYERSVSRCGRPIELSRCEFEMLSQLIRNRVRVVLRGDYARCGLPHIALHANVDVHMWQLLRKLEADPQEPRFLRTVYGSGYVFAWELGRSGTETRSATGREEVSNSAG